MRVSRSLVCGNVVFDRERGAEFVNSPSGSLNQKRCIAGYGVLELLRRVPQPGRVEEDLNFLRHGRDCLRPAIILMDEPLGALDKRLRDHMQIEIRRLAQARRASVVYVTHDQEEALVMSDRICLINEGRIEQIGTPHELYYSPASLFAAGFIGESNKIRLIRASAGRFLLDGVEVSSRTAVSGIGTDAWLIVRPESLRLLSPGQGADNQIQARVDVVVLTGALTRVHAHLADGTPVIAALPSSFGGIAVRAGDTVRLGFDRDAAVILGGTAS